MTTSIDRPIIRWLETRRSDFRWAEFLRATGASQSHAKRALRAAEYLGWIEHSPYGSYHPVIKFRDGSTQAAIWAKLKQNHGLTFAQIDEIVARQSRNGKGWANRTDWTLRKMAKRMGKTLVREEDRFYVR